MKHEKLRIVILVTGIFLIFLFPVQKVSGMEEQAGMSQDSSAMSSDGTGSEESGIEDGCYFGDGDYIPEIIEEALSE